VGSKTRFVICACGWKSELQKNYYVARWLGEKHLASCVFFRQSLRVAVWSPELIAYLRKIKFDSFQLERIISYMTKNKNADDPFTDDDFWGPGSSVGSTSAIASDEMPDAPTEERPQYLKPFHVAKAPMGRCTLVRVTSETSDMSDVILLLDVGGIHFRMGLKLYSEEYKSLLAKYGKKKTEWVNKPLIYKVMPHKGKADGFVAIRPDRNAK
jgi:hypothetical protein